MELLGSLSRSRPVCKGNIRMSGRGMYVDCSGCPGKARLESIECFNGLAERLIPGFSGDIILMDRTDRMYTGTPVEALVAISEIRDDIKTLEEGGGISSLSLKNRTRARRMISSIRSKLDEDPYLITCNEREIRKDISIISGKGSKPIREMLEKVVEGAVRTMRRLEKESGASG